MKLYGPQACARKEILSLSGLNREGEASGGDVTINNKNLIGLIELMLIKADSWYLFVKRWHLVHKSFVEWLCDMVPVSKGD